MRSILLFVFGLYIGVGLYAQSTPQKFFPALAPPSPEAASFTRYGNYQVNLFTGIPEISIPLYEIKVGELMVPISLNYHASGIKVSDIPSRVGLGWDLQAGGSITRKIMGKADENDGAYLSATSSSSNRVRLGSEINTTTDDGLLYLKSVNEGVYDVEPDIFSYSFPGHSGKFLFNQKNNFQPVIIPYAPVSVDMTHSAYHLSLGMKDENGISYRFDTQEGALSGGGITTAAISAWLMSKITSSNGQDSIKFQYLAKPGNGKTDDYFSDYMTLDDNCTGTYGCSTVGTYHTDAGSVVANWQQLTEIDFRNGKVVFEAGTQSRNDFSAFYDLQKRLDNIKIYSYDTLAASYRLLKTISFFQSYFINGTDSTTKRLRLDSLQIKGTDGVVVQTYRFGYNTTAGLPNNLSRRKDYWGYFNNVINTDPFGNPTMVPRMQVPYNIPNSSPITVTVGGSTFNARVPDTVYMQAWILNRINFPTGGYTNFEYETNRYLDDQNNLQLAGGLRIKSIKSYSDSSASPIIKTYKYGTNESGNGRANFFLEDHFFLGVQNYRRNRQILANGQCSQTPDAKTTRTYFANPTVDIESYDGAPVVYPVVTEYTGDATNNTGKTIYTFSDRTDAKTSLIGLNKPIITSYHFERGLLTNESKYLHNSNNTYSLVAENRKTYQYFSDHNSSGGIGLGVLKTRVWEGREGLSYNDGCEASDDKNSWTYNNYEIVTGDNKLVSDQSISYDQNNPALSNSVLTTYTYDDTTHLNIVKTETIDSKGDTLTTAYTYPYNYGTSPYTNMTSNHIFDKQVTDTKKNNSTQLTQLTNNFQAFAGNNYLPANVQLQVKSNAVETRASFNKYDLRGNILEMQKPNDIKQSFIWDYQTMQLVAECNNADSASIAYTSFESDGKGNWVFSGTPVTESLVPTGNRCYNLASDSIKKTGVSSSATYTVAYWSKTGTSYTVTGSTGVKQGNSINGWTYFEHTVTGVTTVKITGSGKIDELRLYPKGAQMKTYTYAPLVGVTSTTDLNGLSTYYEYDGFSRLKNIKDWQGNIVKNFQYNYLNSCGANCVVLPMQTFSGSNTLSYPVGVFNVNQQLLGNATSQSQYISTWNANTANQAKGSIAAGFDSLHFNFTIASGQTAPTAVIGLRYYQVDLQYNLIDAIRPFNGEFVDLGDSNILRLGDGFNAESLPPNTTVNYFPGATKAYIIHSYTNSNLRTLTFYHNDNAVPFGFDNYNNPATSMGKLKNFRGNLPQFTTWLSGSCYQEASMLSIANIINWNSISTVNTFWYASGDGGITPNRNMNFAQDFMANNKGLQTILMSWGGIYLSGVKDSTFKVSRLKSDWNTYFTELTGLVVTEEQWNHEDLSALKKLSNMSFSAGTTDHINNSGTVIPIPVSVIDNIIIQVAAGAGQTVSNGKINFFSGGTTRSSASDTAYNFLVSKGWTLTYF